MVLFVGQVGRPHRGLEAFQEVEYTSFFDDLAKWVVEVDNAADLPQVVTAAFTMAASGRPGPVVVALPIGHNPSVQVFLCWVWINLTKHSAAQPGGLHKI